MKTPLLGLLLGLSLSAPTRAQTNSLPTKASQFTNIQPVGESPYSLKTSREAVLLGAGVVSYGAAYVVNKRLDPLTPNAVSRLNKANVSAFDRSATGHYSPKAANLSDLTLLGSIGLTGAVMLSAKAAPGALPTGQLGQSYSFFNSELYTVGVMYVETMLLTNGLKSTVKDAVERTRPFAYNAAAPLDQKLEKDAQRSFYSGHAANAFATAVFAAEIFRHYHPNSRAKAWVWVGSLGLATGTAVLRYEAGQHFPSDLLVGAAMGSLAGWGIPKLHQTRRRNGQAMNRQNLTVTPWSSNMASGISMRWSISSRSFVTPQTPNER